METSVGSQLKQAREKLGLSIEDAAQAVHIKLPYLQELENDHPELLPSPTNARGFLRLYASFLRISPKLLLQQWDNPKINESLKTSVEEQISSERKTEESKEENKPESISTTEILQVENHEIFETKPTIPKRKSKKSSLTEASSQSENPEERQDTTKESITSPIEEISRPALAPTTKQKSSAAIFIEIGKALHDRRQTLNLSLADVERFTHLKRPYLEAIEGGHFEQLPSTIQGRGMLNNYAAFLSMDGDIILGLYADALEAQRIERLSPRKPEPIVSGGIRIHIPEPFKKYLNPDLLLGGGLILVLFFFLLWGGVQVFNQGTAITTPTAPSISQMLQVTSSEMAPLEMTQIAQGTPSSGSNVTISTETPSSSQNLVPAAQITEPIVTPLVTKNAAPLQLYIIAQERSYMRVTVDSKVVFDGRVVPGSVYTYSGSKTIELLTGNAAGLEVYFNQSYLGKLGAIGEVRDLTFNEKGVTTPTPEPTTTTVVTPILTSTPTPTKTNTPLTTATP